MAGKPSKYHTYLLRMWPVEEIQNPQLNVITVWRVTLENTYTHTRHGFADLMQAFAFLQQQTHCSKEDCDELELISSTPGS